MSFFCTCYQIPFLRLYFFFTQLFIFLSIHSFINSFKTCLLNSYYMLGIWLDMWKGNKRRREGIRILLYLSILWSVTFMFLMFSCGHQCRFYHFHFTDADLGSERLRICVENIVYKQQSYDLTPGVSWFYTVFPSYMGDR